MAFRRGGELPDTGPMSVVYSSDGGKTWGRGENPAVGDGMKNQSYLDLAADPAGNFHAVWLDDREENGNTQGLRYACSSDGGRHWSADITLDPAVCTCCWNRIAVLPEGNLAVLYRDENPPATPGRWQARFAAYADWPPGPGSPPRLRAPRVAPAPH